ncbi:MAG: anhydro-N-acetylmuramic acid kinase [Saprospiraceae bacterium]|nr:anhydro-N-acetylmuramic acid kinase [Saprospiraceae bacterium]
MQHTKYPTSLQLLGMMSGSSLDGLDLALCRFDWDEEGVLTQWQVLAAESLPFSEEWKDQLSSATQTNSLQLLEMHSAFGKYLGQQAAAFLHSHSQTCDAIASHGHTIFHYPEKGFTFQLGAGADIAAFAKCQVIDQLRAADIAQGGQGAPVAPIVELYLLKGYDFYLNLGGIANISAPIDDNNLIAFDIGGANQLLNGLMQTIGQAYDDRGEFARKGQLQKDLLENMNQLDYFAKAYPKSLDNQWVQQQQLQPLLKHKASLEDKLHTVCRQLATQIASSIQQIITKEQLQKDRYRMLITGGGAWNDFLVECIEEAGSTEIVIPEANMVDFKEAILMAWMGALRLQQQPNCLATATGARKNVIGGSIHLP